MIKDLRAIRRGVIIMETISKTKQQLLLEVEELRTRLDATERRLQEANELLQAQIAEQRKPLRKLKNTLRTSWKQYVNLFWCWIQT